MCDSAMLGERKTDALANERQASGFNLSLPLASARKTAAISESIVGMVRVLGFGRFWDSPKEEQDWTLRNHRTAEDGRRDGTLFRYLPKIAGALGVTEFLAPHPAFGNVIVDASALNVLIPVGSENGQRPELRRGAQADGCILHPGEAFAISVGGCGVCWALYGTRHNARLVVGHLALKNLESIVGAMFDALRVPEFAVGEVTAGICFPISPANFEHRFDDPKHGPANRLLCTRFVKTYGPESVLGSTGESVCPLGRINLGWIARQQIRSRSERIKIHKTPHPDTWTAEDGTPLWHTTRSAPPDNQRRNLVVIQHLKPAPC